MPDDNDDDDWTLWAPCCCGPFSALMILSTTMQEVLVAVGKEVLVDVSIPNLNSCFRCQTSSTTGVVA